MPGFSDVIQLFGIAVPAFVAVFVYIRSVKQTERDRTFEFLKDWTSAERSKLRFDAISLIRSFNSKQLTYQEIWENGEKRAPVMFLLNENEFLALFFLAEGKHSFRREIAQSYFRGIILQYWTETQNFISTMRSEQNNQKLFLSFEKLAQQFR